MNYVHEYFIHYHDTDTEQRLSITALMKYFEEIALLQSEELGIGIDYYNRVKMGWLLLKWDVSIKKYPQFMETIKIETIPTAFKGSFANRVFYVYDSNGEKIADAITLWIFVDLNTKKSAKIAPEIHEKYLNANRSQYEFSKLDDINPPASRDFSRQVAIRSGDIDMNNHVNNRRYAEWALEIIPEQVKQNYYLSRFKIHYRKEVMLTDSVESTLELIRKDSEVKCRHGIVKGNENVCLMETLWLRKN